MKRNPPDPLGPVPRSDVDQVKQQYGELAQEYADARAEAAEAAGNPQAGEWQQVEQQLAEADDGEEAGDEQ